MDRIRYSTNFSRAKLIHVVCVEPTYWSTNNCWLPHIHIYINIHINHVYCLDAQIHIVLFPIDKETVSHDRKNEQ